jgi:hypothetical protein
MRNNDKTSAIDYGGYRSTFDVILSPMVSSLASHGRMEFNLKGVLWNNGGSGKGHRRRSGAQGGG